MPCEPPSLKTPCQTPTPESLSSGPAPPPEKVSACDLKGRGQKVKGTDLRGQMLIWGFLRLPAKICGFVHVFFRSLRNDNKIFRQWDLHFQNSTVVAFPTDKKKQRFGRFSFSSLSPQGPPPQKAKILFLLSSRRL